MTDTPSPSTRPSKDEISLVVRHLWDQEGRPADRDTEFWLRAEQELLAASEIKSGPPKLTVVTAPVPLPIATPKAAGATRRRTSAKPVKQTAR